MKCNRNNETLVFTFDGHEPITFDAGKCPALVNDAMMHGFEQKIRDNAAIARKQKDGTVITVTEAMRRDAVAEMVAHLETNTAWNIKASARAPAQNAAIAAMAAGLGITYEEMSGRLANADIDKIKAMFSAQIGDSPDMGEIPYLGNFAQELEIRREFLRELSEEFRV